MSLVAITREVSPGINHCELSYHAREPIDVASAIAQHKAYQDCLTELGLRVIVLPAEPELPDSVFVEDPAIVLDEVAVIMRMGAPSRRAETSSLAEALANYRSLDFLQEPATMDGGDVLRIDRSIFVGLSRRTNREGVKQVSKLLRAHGYTVIGIEVKECLHLKSACSYLGDETLLVNPSWLAAEQLAGYDLLDVPEEEPAAANVLRINDTIVMPASFPRTRALLQKRGYEVRPVEVSELQKAEAGVTCCSLIFKSDLEQLPEMTSGSAGKL
jgi:dimethylargininase